MLFRSIPCPGAAPDVSVGNLGPAASTAFDRPQLIQELIQHELEIKRQTVREVDERMSARLQEQSAKQQEELKRSVTAAMHAAAHQPFQDIHQQQAAAMSEVFRATRETAAVAAEMRQSNRDQRDFIRMNEEQMARLAAMLGEQRGATPAQLEEAVMRLVAAQREQGVGLGAVSLQSEIGRAHV